MSCFQFGSYIIDQESFSGDHSLLASKLALIAASGHTSSVDGSDEQLSVDAETQARLEALLEAAGKLQYRALCAFKEIEEQDFMYYNNLYID